MAAKTRHLIQFIAEQIIGWACVVAFVVEILSPSILHIELAQAGGLGAFGFLLVTGRAKYVLERILRGLRGML